MTVAEAFKFVCRRHATMRVLSYLRPINFTEPLAVGRDAILSFLSADNGITNVLELDGRLLQHEQVYTTNIRNAATLCPDAAIFVSLIQQTTKYWLKTEAVLAATLVTSGGGSLLKKVAARGGQGNSTARALAAVQTTCSLLQPDTPGVTTRDNELENERKKCRTTLLRWDSEDSCADRDEAPGDIVMQEPDRLRTTSGPFYANGALSYWAERRYEYPLLHLVAYSPLGASGSSATSERDCSVAGPVPCRER